MDSSVDKPLKGLKVLITVTPEVAGIWSDYLGSQGAQTRVFSLVNCLPPLSYQAVDEALMRLSHYSAIVFTSQNAVYFFSKRAFDLGIDLKNAQKIYAVGDATKEALLRIGLQAISPSSAFRAQVLLKIFSKNLTGERILFPRGNRGGDELIRGLRERGAEVSDVVFYRNMPLKSEASKIKKAVSDMDVILFGSPSAVEAFVSNWDGDFQGDSLKVVAMGPTTAEALNKAGISYLLSLEASREGVVKTLSVIQKSLVSMKPEGLKDPERGIEEVILP